MQQRYEYEITDIPGNSIDLGDHFGVEWDQDYNKTKEHLKEMSQKGWRLIKEKHRYFYWERSIVYNDEIPSGDGKVQPKIICTCEDYPWF